MSTKLMHQGKKYRTKEKFCALSNVCGGCQWSFIDYEHQLEVKKQIIEEVLKKVLPQNIKDCLEKLSNENDLLKTGGYDSHRKNIFARYW